MAKNIKLSPKYGVNPSITRCECCGKEYGVAMLGKLKGDAEAPRDIFMGLCDDCQKVIDQGGLMIIEVKDGETGKNPYRTGRLVGVDKRLKDELEVKTPICYMEQSMFSNMFNEYLTNK